MFDFQIFWFLFKLFWNQSFDYLNINTIFENPLFDTKIIWLLFLLF